MGALAYFCFLSVQRVSPLPTSSDYSSLTTTYNITNSSTGSTKLRQSPLDFVYAGYYSYSRGSLSNEGSVGYYWSRTAYSDTFAYGLHFDSSSVHPQDLFLHGDGAALRCVGRWEEIGYISWHVKTAPKKAYQLRFLCVDVTNDTRILGCTMILHGLHDYNILSLDDSSYSHFLRIMV